MTRVKFFGVQFFAAGLLVASAPMVRAADLPFEVGTSLTSAVVGFGDNEGSTFGVPSGGFGLANPGVYVSLFVAPRVAIEPQIGLVWLSGGGDSGHFLNVAGQVDYFVNGTTQRSLYVFAAGGIIDISGANTTPAALSGGLGYRIPVGDRLAFRIDGRLTHFTAQGGNQLAFTFSMGGMFGTP